MLLFGLHNRRVVGKVVGKLSEITLVTSLLASWKIAGIRSVRTWAENHGVLCCYESKVSNFKFPEDPELPQEWLKKWKEDRFNPQNTDSRVCADQFTPQVTKAIRSKIIGGFPWKTPKNRIKFEEPYLLCVCCVFAGFPSLWRLFWAVSYSGINHPCPPKNGATSHGNSNCVFSICTT